MPAGAEVEGSSATLVSGTRACFHNLCTLLGEGNVLSGCKVEVKRSRAVSEEKG